MPISIQRVKPGPDVAINLRHPLANGIVSCLLFPASGGVPFDIVSKHFFDDVTSVPSWGGGAFGPAPVWPGSSNNYYKSNSAYDLKVAPTTAITVECWGIDRNDGNNRRMIQRGDDNQAYRLLYEGTWVFEVFGTRVDGSGPTGGAELRHVVGTAVSGGPVAVYVDSIVRGTGTAGAFGDMTPRSTFVGTKSAAAPAGDAWFGTIELLRIWDRALTASEVQELYRDPFGMFQPDSRKVYWDFPAAAAATKAPPPFQRRLRVSNRRRSF